MTKSIQDNSRTDSFFAAHVKPYIIPFPKNKFINLIMGSCRLLSFKKRRYRCEVEKQPQ
jgi:hypothetical protein